MEKELVPDLTLPSTCQRGSRDTGALLLRASCAAGSPRCNDKLELAVAGERAIMVLSLIRLGSGVLTYTGTSFLHMTRATTSSTARRRQISTPVEPGVTSLGNQQLFFRKKKNRYNDKVFLFSTYVNNISTVDLCFF